MTLHRAYGIVVVGAGPAGVAAALAGAAQGAEVLLVDRWTRLGGTVTAGLHRCLCGLYAQRPTHATATLNGGLQRRVVRAMAENDPTGVVVRALGKAWVLEFSTAVWEATLQELCASAPLEVRLDTQVAEVRFARGPHGNIAAVRLKGAASGWVRVGALVDCTGQGEVLGLIGRRAVLPPDAGSASPLSGWAVRLGGLTGDLEELRWQIPYVLTQAAAAGSLPAPARWTMFYPGPGSGQGVCKFAFPPGDPNATAPRVLANRVLDLLRRSLPSLANAAVIETSPRLLPRAGRLLRGQVILSAQDVRSGRRHGAGAVHAWWPMEVWDVARGPVYEYPRREGYDIPEGALRSAQIPNLLAAGACVAATEMAAASVRAGGTCLATGAAAGRLAARL